MGRHDDELPPVEVLGAEPQISSLQEVSTRGPKRSGGRRSRGLLAAVAVVGLLVAGAMLGDDDEVPAASERDETTTTTRRSSTTTRPSSTTTTPTTVPAAPVFAGYDVPGWLLSGSASGWTLVDISTGAQSLPGLPFDNPYSTRPVTGGVVMLSGGEAGFYDLRVPTDAREPVRLGPADDILIPTDRERVWLVEMAGGAGAEEARARLVDLGGRELRSFPLPAGVFNADTGSPMTAATTDGVVFGRAGRVYLADEGGVDAVAVGELVGSVGPSILVFSCGEDASSCGVDLRTPSGSLIRRLDGGVASSVYGWSVSRAVDGRFALVAQRSTPNGDTALITLHAPGGATTATLESRGYVPFAPGWLPGDAGLVGSRDGRIIWVRSSSEGWVAEDLPGLTSVQSEGVLLITG